MDSINFSAPLTKGRQAFERIAELQKEIDFNPYSKFDVDVDLKGKRTGLPFIFLLACLPFYALTIGKTLNMFVDDKTFALMQRIRVPGTSQDGRATGAGNAGFQVLTNAGDVCGLAAKILQGFPVDVSEKLKGDIEFSIGEIFNNASEHSDAGNNIFGGWFTKTRGIYCFSCYDTGVGIPEKVNRFWVENGQKELPDYKALKWAMRKGSSTSKRPNSGQGLDLLRTFVKANSGEMRICSGKALYILNNNREQYIPLNDKFYGTVFEMDIKPDGKFYRYAQEGMN